MSERSAEHVLDLRGYLIMWLNTLLRLSAKLSKEEIPWKLIFFILSDSYLQNQSIAMKGPFYENDTFLYSPAPAILGYKLSWVAPGTTGGPSSVCEFNH